MVVSNFIKAISYFNVSIIIEILNDNYEHNRQCKLSSHLSNQKCDRIHSDWNYSYEYLIAKFSYIRYQYQYCYNYN